MKYMTLVILLMTIGLSCCDRPWFTPQLPWMVKRGAGKEDTINKRQSSDDETCSNAIQGQRCQLGWYEQVYVCTSYSCGFNDYAELFAAYCDKNEAGEWCIESNSGGYISYPKHKCLQQGLDNNSCPSESCAMSLQVMRNSTAGCCIGALQNLTCGTYAKDLFNYTLWSQCGVEPFQQCEQTISRTPISNTRLCTDEEYLRRLLETGCSPQFRSIYIKMINEVQEECAQSQETLMKSIPDCSINSQGELCDVFSLNNESVILMLTECTSIGQFSCAQSCREALERIKDEQGCCFNYIYNTSQLDFSYPSWISGQDVRFITSYTLWNQCGVETPPLTCHALFDNLETTPTSLFEATPPSMTCNLSSVAMSPNTPPDDATNAGSEKPTSTGEELSIGSTNTDSVKPTSTREELSFGSTQDSEKPPSTRGDMLSRAHGQHFAILTLTLTLFIAVWNI